MKKLQSAAGGHLETAERKIEVWTQRVKALL